jgi:polysaccharide biosynthesis protein PslH
MSSIEKPTGAVSSMPDGASRPKLLFLCQTLPYPPDSGVHLRTYNVLRLLARAFDITALCFFRKATRSSAAKVQESLEGLRGLAKVDAFPIPQEHSRARLVWDHLRSVATGTVYTRYAYQSVDFTRRLRALLRTNTFDLVHMDSLDLSAYLPHMTKAPVICTHHNVESVLLRRWGAAKRSPITRRYIEMQARLAQNEERFWCPRVALNVVVSAADLELLRQIAPRARFTVIPSGVDTNVFRPGSQGGAGIIFVGGYGWFPNRDGMLFFCQDILPQIRATGVDPAVTWIGQAPDQAREELSTRYGIALTGYVDDVRPYVQDAACYIVPLRIGGGTRLKILDAWAMGKAIVSTSIGCEGLDAVDGENILVRDEPADFAAAVKAVLEDVNLRKHLAEGARKTAATTYDWEAISGKMIGEYTRLLSVT